MSEKFGTRVKTDIRTPVELWNSIDSICKKLGMKKNAFWSIGASMLLIQLSGLIEGTKRKQMLAELEKMFHNLLDGVRKSL